jgi:hypothetical protein
MAVGQVSGIAPGDAWQLIDTKINTTAGNITFTGISGYKKLLVVIHGGANGGSAGASYLNIQASGTYYGGGSVLRNSTNWQDGTGGYQPLGANYSDVLGYVTIDNVDQNGPHLMDVKMTGGIGGGAVTGPAITQFTIQHDYSMSATSRAYLYGLA